MKNLNAQSLRPATPFTVAHNDVVVHKTVFFPQLPCVGPTATPEGCLKQAIGVERFIELVQTANGKVRIDTVAEVQEGKQEKVTCVATFYGVHFNILRAVGTVTVECN